MTLSNHEAANDSIRDRAVHGARTAVGAARFLHDRPEPARRLCHREWGEVVGEVGTNVRVVPTQRSSH